jgi:hypothetical protein
MILERIKIRAVTACEPADQSVAWILLPAQDHDAFRAAYHAAAEQGTGDDDTWARARGWAVALSLVYLAHSADNPQLADIGRRTLSAVLA